MLFSAILPYLLSLVMHYPYKKKSAGLANALRLTTSLTRMVLVCAKIGKTQSVLLYFICSYSA